MQKEITQTLTPLKTMKTETKSVLSALAYLIEKQGLTPDQIRNIIIKQINESNEN